MEGLCVWVNSCNKAIVYHLMRNPKSLSNTSGVGWHLGWYKSEKRGGKLERNIMELKEAGLQLLPSLKYYLGYFSYGFCVIQVSILNFIFGWFQVW